MAACHEWHDACLNRSGLAREEAVAFDMYVIEHIQIRGRAPILLASGAGSSGGACCVYWPLVAGGIRVGEAIMMASSPLEAEAAIREGPRVWSQSIARLILDRLVFPNTRLGEGRVLDAEGLAAQLLGLIPPLGGV